MTAGQVSAGLDAMYADYRNRMLPTQEILVLVLSSIRGGEQTYVDNRLQYLRQQQQAK